MSFSILDDTVKKHLAEIENILDVDQEALPGNALSINLEMQKRLIEMRGKIMKLNKIINERFRENEQTLIEAAKKPKLRNSRGAYQKGRSYFYQGSLYFRDRNLRNCPNTEDYFQRKRNGEIFPVDWKLRSIHRWTWNDRDTIYEAVKEQIYDHVCFSQPASSFKKPEKLDFLAKGKFLERPLEELLKEVQSDFEIDWVEISHHYLKSRHCPTSCEAYWNTYLKPTINRSRVSDDEIKKLVEIAEDFKYQDWDAISLRLGTGRSFLQCFLFYTYHFKKMQPFSQRKWNKKNDNRLLEIVKSNTVGDIINWPAVYAYFPHILRHIVKNRYLVTLNPSLKKGLFTPSEDILLLAAYHQYNGDIKRIPKTLFPDRNLEQLRAHFKEVLCHRAIIKPWTEEDDHKLMDFVTLNGDSSWTQCSKEVFQGCHTGSSCRTRYNVIRRSFLKNPNVKMQEIRRRNRTLKLKSSVSTENYVEKLNELKNKATLYQKFLPAEKYKARKKKKREENKKQSRRSTANSDSELDSDSDSDASFRELAWSIKQAGDWKKEKDTDKSPEKIRKKRRKKGRQGHRKKRKTIYKDRLRPQELIIYNSVKYSYGFRINVPQNFLSPNSWKNIYPVMRALGMDVPLDYEFKLPHTQKNMSATNRFCLRKYCSKALQHVRLLEDQDEGVFKYSYKLPPSWSSLLALRAFFIMSCEDYKSDDKNAQYLIKTISSGASLRGIDDNPHVEVFRHRLQTLLLNTIFLSRMTCQTDSTGLQADEGIPLMSGGVYWSEKMKANTNLNVIPIAKEPKPVSITKTSYDLEKDYDSDELEGDFDFIIMDDLDEDTDFPKEV